MSDRLPTSLCVLKRHCVHLDNCFIVDMCIPCIKCVRLAVDYMVPVRASGRRCNKRDCPCYCGRVQITCVCGKTVCEVPVERRVAECVCGRVVYQSQDGRVMIY